MRISQDMNLRDLAERTGDTDLDDSALEYIRMRLCSMGWSDTAWLNILRDVSEPMIVYSVDADPETGEWIGEPEITGETSTFLDWCAMEDTDAERFDHYEHNLGDGKSETRLIRATWIA